MNNYYVAWIPPNRDFKDIACDGTGNINLTTATRIANKLNNETRGSLGHYAPRKSQYLENMNKKKIELDGFGDIIDFAGSLGWIDNHGDSISGNWGPTQADECEEEAINFIESKGYEIHYTE